MPWFTVQARDDNPRQAHVVIDKPIGSDWAPDWISDFMGLQAAREFIAALDALGELDEITVEINSPGGDVASGVRIYHYLRDHQARIHTRVTGMAASIATIILMAGETRSMAIGSNLMTHRASALICGAFNVAEMEEIASNLKKVDGSLVNIYAAATGKDKSEIKALLDKGDTYLDAEEALEWGFATNADESLRAVASADPRLYMKQLQQASQLADARAQLAQLRGEAQTTMTAADALALAFDVTPQEAEAQAADLGDRIIALQQAQPGSIEGFEITASSLRDSHPGVVAEIEGAAVKAIGPAPDADEVIAGERTRVVAIVNACQTTGQSQLLDKLVTNGMAEEQAIEYIYDVAAASGNKQTINGNHSPEGGQRAASIDHQKIYARLNRNPKAQ